MKKIISLLLTFALLLSFSGCVDFEDTYSSSNDSAYSSIVDSATDNTDSSTSEATSSETEKPSSSTTSSENKKPTNSVGSGSATAVNLANIPAYSGKAYVAVNNNVPNFSSTELTTQGYEKYSNLDSLGRTRVAVASVGMDTMPGANEKRGSISSIKPTGWQQAQYDCISGGWLYNRCHLIGWQLSAENANKSNLITGTKYLNISGMLPFENMVSDYIKETGNHVAYRITPIYDGNNLLASGVQMEAYSVEDDGGGICFNIYCYNVQPEITINYATGLSSGPSSKPSSSTSSTVKPNPEPENNTGSSNMVWIPNSGSKYHSHAGCSNMKNPSQVTKSEAENRGYEPCKKCW